MDTSDEALFAAYVAGDAAAFRELFRRYAPRLKALMARGMGRHQDVDDLVQQTFLQLHRARNDFRPGHAFRGWVVTIALNLKRSHLRKPVRARAGSDWIEQFPDPASEVAPEQGLLNEDVRAAIASLPENQRVVIELHWLEGKSFQEVSEATGASVAAVKVRAHRGYARLRTILAEEPVTEEGAAPYSDKGEDS